MITTNSLIITTCRSSFTERMQSGSRRPRCCSFDASRFSSRYSQGEHFSFIHNEISAQFIDRWVEQLRFCSKLIMSIVALYQRRIEPLCFADMRTCNGNSLLLWCSEPMHLLPVTSQVISHLFVSNEKAVSVSEVVFGALYTCTFTKSLVCFTF
jgi:hypothetical protein